MKKLTSALAFLACVFATCAMPAAAQQAQVVRIYVIVTNKDTNDPLNGLTVHYDEPPTACNGMHGNHVTGRTSRPLIGQPGGAGEAAMRFITCTGPATITVDGGSEYNSQTTDLEIAPGQVGYNVFVKLEPKGRVVHIRVQGRSEKGELIPVRALVYDRNGQRIAMTDNEGLATAQIREALGETVTLHAEAPHWRTGTASYIAGAYHSGSRITRSEDYINIVLGEEEQTTQEIQLSIMVKGTKGESTVPIEHALIYDGEGHYLTATDDRGHAAAIVEAPFGETFRLKAEATRWKSETQTLLARSETKNRYAGSPGSKRLFQQVRFLLEPNANEIGDLVVEVLDRDTDRPVPAAQVRLYKPSGYPGTLEGVETSNHNGEVTFDAAHIERALSGQETRVGVTHGGYLPAMQTVVASLTTGEAPRYVVYLHPNKENTKWSGTWVQGPYTIQISGGSGSLGYNALRSEGAGTCCPLVDQSGGNCEVIGNTAICQYHGHYHDSAKDVTYGGHATLTLSGDYIQYRFTQVTGEIALSGGVKCPDITQCTALHPGAVFTGSWTRKKQ